MHVTILQGLVCATTMTEAESWKVIFIKFEAKISSFLATQLWNRKESCVPALASTPPAAVFTCRSIVPFRAKREKSCRQRKILESKKGIREVCRLFQTKFR